MPLKSKAQLRALAAKERSGELPEGTLARWLAHTKNVRRLPERAKKKKRKSRHN